MCSLAAVLLAPTAAVQAQRLLTLVPGVAEAASVGDPGPSIGPVPTAVQVDLALLRGAPLRLEVPTPDGSVLSAERSVFEDRRGGDLMWSGGQPDAGYDTVVLTVEGGRLVGRFGAAGGGVYQIHAERDGRGGMAPIVGAEVEAWCGVEADTEDSQDTLAHDLAGAHAADRPERVSHPQRHDRLDILVAYTAKAAENWADRGGAEAAIRHAGDYLRMVFRNNGIDVVPHIAHIAQASAVLDRVGRDLGRHEWKGWSEDPLLRVHMNLDRELWRLQLEHEADMVYLFHGESPHLHGGACGKYSLLKKDYEPDWFRPRGWSSNDPRCGDYAAVFVHELGHGLGADHEPANLLGFLDPSDPVAVLEEHVAPYALGYVNFDVMPSLGTAMSYQGQIEPFYSTSRIRPYGGTVIGIADEQDNERTLRQTIAIVAQVSDHLPSLEGLPAQPTNVRARFEGAFAHLSWQDNAADADGYKVLHHVFWGERNAYDILRVGGRTEAVLPLEVTVPGARHEFSVIARKGDADSLASSRIALIFPGDPIEAPSELSVVVDPQLSSVEVRWTDNSENETGFDVQLLRAGDPIRRQRLPADSTNTIFYASNVLPQQRAEYGVRVVAFSSSGQSESSETAAFRWDHPLAAGPVSNVAASAIGPNTVRVTWAVDPKVEYYRVYAELPGWKYNRRWFPPRDGHTDTARVDFEGLAPGGRYRFEVIPLRPPGLPSRVHLALGQRGAGPQAVSDPSLTDDGGLRLSWTDNSSDEVGFEIQTGVVDPGSGGIGHRQRWWRAATFPPDTESADFHPLVNVGDELVVRVFAWNERGFSASSPFESRNPRIASLIATPSDTETELRWDVWSAEAVTKIQVRWKEAALLFDDAVDTWTDLPASARAFTVTGLKNGTRYVFAVRYVTVSGAGREATIVATPRDTPAPPGGPPAGSCQADAETLCLQNSRFRVKVNWRNADGESGVGQVVEDRTDDSGMFEFFGPLNWEILIKVLDGCRSNGRMWVLGAATTDLGYRIVLTDTVTGESRSYENEPGQRAPAIVDTDAFSRSCGGGEAP